MLRMAILFFVIALIAGLLGLFRTEYIASEIAWVLFVRLFGYCRPFTPLGPRVRASSLKLERSYGLV